MQETFDKRLRKALNIRNMTQAELCEKTEIPKSAISQYLSGGFKPRQNRTHLIAKTLDVNEAWLMGYDVDIKRQDMNPEMNNVQELTDKYDNVIPIKTKKIPLLGEIACGEPIVANRDYEIYVDATVDIRADYAVQARGDSMINARIFDGDIVFIREQPDVENGEIAAIIIEDEITLKRVYKDRDTLELRAENPRIKPLLYRGEQLNHIHILGKAIAFQSDIV